MTSINQKLTNNVEWTCTIEDEIKVFDCIQHVPIIFFLKKSRNFNRIVTRDLFLNTHISN